MLSICLNAVSNWFKDILDYYNACYIMIEHNTVCPPGLLFCLARTLSIKYWRESSKFKKESEELTQNQQEDLANNARETWQMETIPHCLHPV